VVGSILLSHASLLDLSVLIFLFVFLLTPSNADWAFETADLAVEVNNVFSKHSGVGKLG
jgi:hypothetical protein